jgi:hypothetical protein
MVSEKEIKVLLNQEEDEETELEDLETEDDFEEDDETLIDEIEEEDEW